MAEQLIAAENSPENLPESLHGRVTDVVRTAVIYLVSYWFLDWISFIYPFEALNITPWNPPIAVSVVLLLRKGIRWAPLLFVGAFGADVLIRHLSAPLVPALATDLAEALIYTGAVWAMRRFGMNADLRNFRDVIVFIVVVVVAAALMATTYIACFWVQGVIPNEVVLFLIMKYWVGDAIGIAVLAPLLLVHGLKLPSLASIAPKFDWELLFQAASLLFAFWAMFFWQDPVFGHVFYPIFVPLIWVTARRGLPGAVVLLVLIQCGIIAGIELHSPGLKPETLTVTRLQFLMLGMSCVGLLLGAVISEREKARTAAAASEAQLRRHMSTAGEMSKTSLTEELAAILAHEINQPLSAIINYASACDAILSAADGTPAKATQQLAKIILQAKRAGMVIADLREFVRSSKINPEPVSMALLVRGVLTLLGDDIDRAGVDVNVDIDDRLVASFDRLQIEQVLINLIRNSIEALRESGARQNHLEIIGRLGLGNTLQMEICDDGPGIAPEVMENLFDPFVTTRVSGMGLGLSISRSIVEAHGGKLIVDPVRKQGAGFIFSLPLRQ